MGVLAKSEIRRRLDKGEIFSGGSWEGPCLRSAAYNLRVATDYLIDPKGTRYWPEAPRGKTVCEDPFWLHPGEVAFVSSVERLCMPFDLAGNIAQKFSVTRRGILVLGGLLVDPGYGCEYVDGEWRVREEQRLHFQLVNVGEEKFKISPGTSSIAAIQFIELEGTVRELGDRESDVYVPDSDDLLNDLFRDGDDEPLKPMAFFPRMTELSGGLRQTTKQVERQKIKLDSTKLATDQLFVFGIALLAITLFTVGCAALIDAIADGSTTKAAESIGNADTSGGLSHEGLIIAVVAIGVVIAFCLAAASGWFYGRTLRLRGRSAEASDGGK